MPTAMETACACEAVAEARIAREETGATGDAAALLAPPVFPEAAAACEADVADDVDSVLSLLSARSLR